MIYFVLSTVGFSLGLGLSVLVVGLVDTAKLYLPTSSTWQRLVFEFTGPGTAWYQTRDLDSLVSILAPRLPNSGQDS
jgi:hypothetical protein